MRANLARAKIRRREPRARSDAAPHRCEAMGPSGAARSRARRRWAAPRHRELAPQPRGVPLRGPGGPLRARRARGGGLPALPPRPLRRLRLSDLLLLPAGILLRGDALLVPAAGPAPGARPRAR